MDNNILNEQLQTLLIMLERPLVQQQVLLLVAILGIAGGTLALLRRQISPGSTRWQRQWRHLSLRTILLRAAPVLVSLALATLAVPLLEFWGRPPGLLRSAMILFWTWLGFVVISLALEGLLGEAVRPYQRWVVWPGFIGIIIWELLDSFLNLTFLASIPLFQFFNANVTLGRLAASILLLYLFIIVAWVVRDVLQHVMSGRTNAERGVVFTVSTISRYFIIFLGIIVSLQTIGLDLSTLTVIGGGLSIGIGIGLQRIVANFISGIVLLFEQSLRPGDVIELDGEIGTVEKVNIRATVVRTLNNVEVIVPNETFLTTQVKTFTKSNQRVRVLLPIGVSYKSDPKEVRRVVVETAVKHGLVLSDPEPTLLFRGYGDSSLNFDLAVWIDQPQRIMRVRSDLYFMIFETLARHGIEIPYPQRDLNLGEGWEKLLSRQEESPPPNR